MPSAQIRHLVPSVEVSIMPQLAILRNREEIQASLSEYGFEKKIKIIFFLAKTFC